EYTTHCLKQRDSPVIPVLMGYRVPCNDTDEDRLKHAVVMLILFKPWSNNKSSPVKATELGWEDVFNTFKPTVSPDHLRISLNMQLPFQTRDAK
ncbi:hypothetical protein DFH08DRAFT_618106, partial [Mycena albidolilacea]